MKQKFCQSRVTPQTDDNRVAKAGYRSDRPWITRCARQIVLLFTAGILSLTAFASKQFVAFSDGASYLKLTGRQDTVIYDPGDWEGVKIAVNNLRKDLKAVTGHENAPLIVGTCGRSKAVEKYKDVASRLNGKWEQYEIFTDGDKLVIMGSDKRGTIYGIYELSRQIGVSPWYWWADVPITKHDELFIIPGSYTDGEPAVKYRGIFINDEWPSFGGWATKRFGGVNSEMYATIFELLLRLKANYLWPAMWATAFNEDDPLSPELADRMGIVMGTSHHEPMMRSHREYLKRKQDIGPWDYKVNRQNINRFFREGMERNKDYDNLVTVGMRGDGDVAMGNGNDAENMKTLSDVIAGQRSIIKDIYGSEDAVPQLWAIFTEVQRYYDAGFNVPDDVTLLFCDNNWGYIRRIGKESERGRKGGMGLYYHIDMNGGPWNDRWVNTTTIPKLREQLNLAYRTGLDRIWIINVGDIKPKEIPIDFIMNYAWNPDSINPGDEFSYLNKFADSAFGPEYSRDIADIISKYSKYNLIRKPEVQVPGIFNLNEMHKMDSLWSILTEKAEYIKTKLPAEAQDAYYQLVYYPTVASAGVAKIYNCATAGDSLSIENLMKKDVQLADYYNNVMSGGKWSGMMQDNHIGYTKWSIPEKNVNPMTLGFKVEHNLVPASETNEYSIPAHKYVRNIAGKNAKWIFLPDLGREEGCMGSNDVTAKSENDLSGARLEYDITLAKNGQVALGILPTQDINPARGLRLGVRIDHGPVVVLDARQGLHDEFKEYTKENLAVSSVLQALPTPQRLSLNGWIDGKQLMRRNEVFDNIRWLPVSFDAAPGKHKLSVIMIDPEVVLQKIVVNPDDNNYSYFGAGNINL